MNPVGDSLTQQATTEAPADLTHRVHLARSATPKAKGSDPDPPSGLRASDIACFVCLAALVALAGLKDALGLSWSTARIMYWAAPAFLAPLLLAQLFTWRRERRWLAKHPYLPAEPDPEFRLRYVGDPDELSRIGVLQDVPFEPRTFWLPSGFPAAPGVRKCRWALIGVALAGILLVSRLIRAHMGIMLDIAAATAVAYLLLAVLAPAYVTIVPGRLTLAQRLPLGAPCVREYDLRNARVLIDLRREYVALTATGGQAPLSFSLALVPRRAELAYYVFLGALSSYTPPTAEDGA